MFTKAVTCINQPWPNEPLQCCLLFIVSQTGMNDKAAQSRRIQQTTPWSNKHINNEMEISRNPIRCSDFNRPECFHPEASSPVHTCNSLNCSKIPRLPFPVNVANQLFVNATDLLCFHTSVSECLLKILAIFVCLKWPSNGFSSNFYQIVWKPGEMHAHTAPYCFCVFIFITHFRCIFSAVTFIKVFHQHDWKQMNTHFNTHDLSI